MESDRLGRSNLYRLAGVNPQTKVADTNLVRRLDEDGYPEWKAAGLPVEGGSLN
ncbi:hypothetical protein MAUB1S_08818 [Mycolicibacterium aubagnense]